MTYDFDTVHDRRGTDSVKYDLWQLTGGRSDLQPLWVADMDFALPEEILADIRAAVDSGIFGYTFAGKAYQASVQHWLESRLGWQTEAEWMVQTPGVCFALGVAVQALTEPGDAVLIQQPVYYPFANTINANKRRLVDNELVYDGRRYSIDLADFERKVAEEGVKLFILCSPHNPVGRVWTPDELEQMGQICLEHGVPIVSDEIHADFVYPGHTHHVLAGLGERFADNCIVCTAPSKTFNLAGLQTSNIFIPNPSIRQRFRDVMMRFSYEGTNMIGMAATRAVYEKGGPWHDQMMDYLMGNIAYVRRFLETHIPKIHLVEPEGTYLLWLDCRGLGLPDGAVDEFFTDKANLWLDAGTLFGERSAQFERLNIACPRSVIERALKSLERAVATL